MNDWLVVLTLFGSILLMAIGAAGLVFDTFGSSDNATFAIDILVLLAGILLFIFFVVGIWKLNKADWEYSDTPYSAQRIVSLNDNNLSQGRIYMRRGYIEDDLYYQYMMRVSGGGFKANKVKASTATLYYSDEDYRVEWYTKTRNWLYFEQEAKYQKIYIPEGSITDDYSVDLE